MAHAFPAAKLLAIVVKQISKPLATRVKNRAKSSQFFRDYIIMPPAQFYHWMEIRWKMHMLNLGKPAEVTKLNEQMAIELGAELLSEGLMLLIASTLVVAEYYRSSRKEAAKEAERIRKEQEYENRLFELEYIVTELEVKLRQQTRRGFTELLRPGSKDATKKEIKPREPSGQYKLIPIPPRPSTTSEFGVVEADNLVAKADAEKSKDNKQKEGLITKALKGLESTFKN